MSLTRYFCLSICVFCVFEGLYLCVCICMFNPKHEYFKKRLISFKDFAMKFDPETKSKQKVLYLGLNYAVSVTLIGLRYAVFC